MTDVDAELLRSRAEAATPGPWYWRNGQDTHLFGAHTRVVMSFTRRGMQGAQPQFRRDDNLLYDAGSENLYLFPDAAHIAGMDPQTTLALLDDLDTAEAVIAGVRALVDEWDGVAREHPVWRLLEPLRALLSDTKESS